MTLLRQIEVAASQGKSIRLPHDMLPCRACLQPAEFPVRHAVRMEIDLASVGVGKESESLLRIYPSNSPSRPFVMLHIVAHFVDLCPQLSHRPPKRIMDGKCDVCLSWITILKNPTDIHFAPAR